MSWLIYARRRSDNAGKMLFWMSEGYALTSDLNRAGLFSEPNAKAIQNATHGEHAAVPLNLVMTLIYRRVIYLGDGVNRATMEGRL